MTITTELAERILAAKEKSTEGVWHFDDNFALSVTSDNPSDMDIQHVRGRNGENDMRFIALCSPKNVGSLIGALSAKDRQRAELSEHVAFLEKRLKGTEESLRHAVDRASELEREKDALEAVGQALRDDMREARAQMEALPEQQPAEWITYYPDTDEETYRAHSRSNEATARRIASEIGGYVVPVYHGMPAPAAQPVTVTKEHSRQLFEQWCTVNKERNKHHPDYYAHLPAREQWAAWQAALTAAGITIAEGE